jgi:DUF1365 family protein
LVAEVSNTPWNEKHCYVLRLATNDPSFDGTLRVAMLDKSVDGSDASTLLASVATASAESQSKPLCFEHPKEFHVSPFMPMSMTYRWRITEPRERLAVNIENYSNDTKRFNATLSLQRRPITRWQLARVLLRYPVMTLQMPRDSAAA